MVSRNSSAPHGKEKRCHVNEARWLRRRCEAAMHVGSCRARWNAQWKPRRSLLGSVLFWSERHSKRLSLVLCMDGAPCDTSTARRSAVRVSQPRLWHAGQAQAPFAPLVESMVYAMGVRSWRCHGSADSCGNISATYSTAGCTVHRVSASCRPMAGCFVCSQRTAVVGCDLFFFFNSTTTTTVEWT
eukprot:scaffold1837_cov102-Isochrysis_galbana.AAC.2